MYFGAEIYYMREKENKRGIVGWPALFREFRRRLVSAE